MNFLELFVRDHNYLAYFLLFLGMFVDNSVSLFSAIFFAVKGYLSWPTIILVAYLGIIASDIAYYAIGRYSRGTRFGLWLSRKFSAYENWFHENLAPRYLRVVFASKFIHYVNRIIPVMAGWHGLDFKKFLKAHILAGTFWLSAMLIMTWTLGSGLNLIGAQWALKYTGRLLAGLIILIILAELVVKKIFSKYRLH